MERVISEKVARFIRLQKQFSKNHHEVFKDYEDEKHGFKTTPVNGQVNFELHYKSEGLVYSGGIKIAPTAAEKLREKADAWEKLNSDWQEYKKLEEELFKYFTSLNTLTEPLNAAE